MTRIGVGSGFAGDRRDPAVHLARDADLDVLVFECLAERTIALRQTALLSGQGPGYDELVADRVRDVAFADLTVVTNGGAADPEGLAALLAGDLDGAGTLPRRRVAVVTGDDVLADLDPTTALLEEPQLTVGDLGDRLVSANAYLGAAPIVEALGEGAQVVVAGRVSDPSLFLAPLAHAHGWDLTDEADRDRVAAGTLVGHLLECGGQLTGGYFAGGGDREVPGLARLGFPFADVDHTGTATLGKLPGSGGRLDRRTVLEQLFYEVHDPREYLTPDVVLDMSEVDIEEKETDAVVVRGVRGRERTATLKVSLGVRQGWTGDASLLYAGYDALSRARLAADIVRERWHEVLGRSEELSIAFEGLNAARPFAAAVAAPAEVRVRFRVRSLDRSAAVLLGQEVEGLYTNGPSGGGGCLRDVAETTGVYSCLVPREQVRPTWRMVNPR